ncbi:FEM1C-like protein [Mya arenaria]|uniref:FEM1C-like protein n=1 Tax=Mya arenaria TaxID=6604 RepID=A0ABY7EJN6_MYAAR|nr:FEM1C-like protein [Mya arenaria]
MRVDETAGREWTTKSDKTVQNGILPSASGNARQSENKTANDEDEISARSKNIAGDRLNDATSDKHNPSFNQGAENSKTVSNKSTTLDIFSEVNDKNGSENSIILPDINKSASLDGASTACRTMDAVYEGASPSGRIISTDPNGVSTSGRTMDTVLLQQRIDRYEQKDPATSEVDPGSLAEEMTIALSRLSSPVDGPSKPVALDLPPQKLQLPGDIGEQKTSPPSLPVQVGKTHPSRQIVVADTGKQEKQPGQEPADNRVKEGQRTDRRKAVTTRKVKITLDKKKSASKQYKTDDMSFLDLSPRSYHGAWRTVGRGGGGDRKGRLVDNHVKKHALYHARFAAAPDRRQAFYHARYYYYSSNLIYSRYRISRVFMRKEKAGLHLMRPETNYIRLCLACVEVGTELLRDAFRRFLGSMQPYQTYRRVNDVIWRWKAAKSDTSEVADVTRIRDLRNFLLDIKERTLFEDEYKRKIDDFKKVTKRLASESSIKERLDRLDALQKKEPEVSDTEKLVLLLKDVELRQSSTCRQAGVYRDHHAKTHLTSADMRQMLSYHILVDSQVRAEIYRNAHLHTGSLGFPQCCALYVSQRRLHDMWAHFFEHPIDVLEGDLETLHRSDIHAYFALVVMMFQPGARLYAKKLRDLQDETFLQQLQSLAEVCKVPITEKLPEQLLTSLSGQLTPYVYWEKNIDCYTFSHESVMELMMSSFVKRHPQHVLETCELQFLLDYVFTEENLLKSRNQVFAMRISPDHFWLLSQSIDHYINYGHVVAMATHRVLRDPGFREFFFTYLEKRGESEHIVLAEDSSVKEGVSRRPVGLMFSSINQDKPNVGLVRALWKTGLYQKHSSPWVAGELRSSLLMAVRRGSLEREKWSQEQLDVALVRAARVQSAGVDVVKLLLGAGASPTSIRASSTALCEAAKADNVKTVQHLLSCGEPGCGSSVTERDLAEGTPLHHACDAGHMDVIQILLKRDASVNAPDEQGMTPFLVAVGWGREEVLQTLLTKKVNPLHVDDHKNNMLHICGATGHDVVMKILVKNFPDVIQKLAIARNVYGWTPLDFSFRLGHLQVTKILVAQVLKVSTPRSLASLSDSKTFVHTRFSIARREEFDFLEPSTCRFVWASGQNAVYRVPRCRWHIEAAVPEEYEETRKFVAKHEEKLRWCLAKT